MYFHQLERYLRFFKREKIGCFVYEDLDRNPEEVLRRVYRFLGVRADFSSPLVHSRFNVGVFQRGFSVKTLTAVRDGFYRIPLLRSAVKGLQRRRRINSLLEKFLKTHKKEMEPETIGFLVRHFRIDAEKMSAFLERDLLNEWEFFHS
jgi:hypothetical protein